MTSILYDFLAHVSEAIERIEPSAINRIYINFYSSLPTYELVYHKEDKSFLVEVQYFTSKNPGGLRLDLGAYVPTILENNWIKWDGCFSVLYDQFLRIRSIDTILATLT